MKQNKRLNELFYVIMTFLIVLFILFLVYPTNNTFLASQKSIIFLEGRNWFADFFNVLRYISDDAGYYFSKINESDGHSGFPISLAVLYPFTQLVDYSNMSLQDCWQSKSAVFSCIVYLFVLVFFFWDSLNRVCNKYKVSRFNLFIFLFSSVFIFSLERANFVFLSASLINYYLTYYDSNNQKLKGFSLICLCVAAALKGYPAFFGLLLLKERRYKDILFCIVFTLVIAIVPFFFMNRGFENIPKMLENTGFNNDAYIHTFMYMFGIHKLVYMACMAFHLSEDTVNLAISFTRIVESLLTILTFILVLLEERFYRRCLLIACAVLLFPINSGFYCALYLLPVLIVFFEERVPERKDYFIMVLFCLVLNPLQVVLPYKESALYLSSITSNISLIIIWIILIISSLPLLKTINIKK